MIVEELNDDFSNIDVILEAYVKLMNGYKKDLSLNNKTLQVANMEQASVMAYYDQIKIEVEIILDLCDLKVKEIRAKTLKNILDKSNKAYGERTVEKLIDENPSYIKMYKTFLKIKEVYLKLKSIVDCFDQRGFSLNNITKVRVADMENAILHE